MSQTQSNLLKAFAGESMARNKYTFFAKKALEDGYVWLARIFEETADNERAHAEREYELMKGKVEMTNHYDIHAIGETLENLKAAAAGEKYEWGTMYPEFEKIARQENENEIADVFKEIGEVEEKHEERYLKLAKRVEEKTLYLTEIEVEWKCLNCGYIHKGTSAPEKCPSCDKPQGYYMEIGYVR
ncbi:MAG: rubrerythrin family protein [Patescibacteria group bacterium]